MTGKQGWRKEVCVDDEHTEGWRDAGRVRSTAEAKKQGSNAVINKRKDELPVQSVKKETGQYNAGQRYQGSVRCANS